MRIIIVVVLSIAGCSFSVNYDGTRYQCTGEDRQCPEDHACREGFCEYAPACSSAASAGDDHTCAVRTDRTVWCWGRNDAGQLGDGTTDDASEPVQVRGIDTAFAVATGSRHTCALLDAGEVQCWGVNRNGQLGNDSQQDSSTPVTVELATGIVEIAAGDNHTCARKDDASVWCWGDNESSQLGTASETQYKPAIVPNLAATRIWAGADSSCALVAGALQCWGSNDNGLLGVGDLISRPEPRTVPLTDVKSVAIGRVHMCVVGRKPDDAQQVWCSGFNAGRLGVLLPGSSSVPVAAALPPDEVTGQAPIIAEVAVGEQHSCARGENGRVWCWGTNQLAQLGNGIGKDSNGLVKQDDQFAPVLTQFADAERITASEHHTCIRDRRGGMWCAGHNGYGQRGNGQRTSQRTPRQVPNVGNAQRIAAGGTLTCSVDIDHVVRCWGNDHATGKSITEATPVPGLPFGAIVGGITAGESHACAIVAGEVWCWGSNEEGQLGDGVIDERNIGVSRSDARPVLGLIGVPLDVVAGRQHTCALVAISTTGPKQVWCWGLNDLGQSTGTATITPRRTPAPVPDGSTPAVTQEIALGSRHTCRLADGGNVGNTAVCWGHDGAGQLGDGLADDGLVRVGNATSDPLLGGIVQIAANNLRTYALVDADFDGRVETVATWGECAGAVGDPTRPCGAYASAIRFPGTVDALDVGDDMVCARLGTALSCWGNNEEGQLGISSYAAATEPTPVNSLPPIDAFAVGGKHACAITNGGTVSCWGSNTHGQLGDGVAASRSPTGVRLVCD